VRLGELQHTPDRPSRGRTRAFVVLAAVVGIALVVVTVVPAVVKARGEAVHKKPHDIGVPLFQASCAPVLDDHVSDGGRPVPTGAQSAYPTVPPSSGRAAASGLPFGRAFYGRGDDAPVERLVRNLRNGYVVVWYDSTVSGTQLQALEDLGALMPKQRPKILVAPWDASRGAFPRDEHVALVAWGHREFCGKVSGRAVADFARMFPPSIAPEPNGA